MQRGAEKKKPSAFAEGTVLSTEEAQPKRISLPDLLFADGSGPPFHPSHRRGLLMSDLLRGLLLPTGLTPGLDVVASINARPVSAV